MRQQFRGYYQPSETELDELWTTGLIVLDTNALLNFYRYTSSTRADFTALLASVRARLWLPHQVGLEFHRNRLEVIDQQEAAFDSIESSLIKAKNLIEKELNGFRRHPSLNPQGITSALDLGFAGVRDTISESRRVFVESPLIDAGVDSVLTTLTDLFDSRVGGPLGEEALEALYAEGATRYENAVPPGYEDRRKPEPERYGDLILWMQLLAKGTEVGQPVIFVTDDGKEDWWHQFKGRTIGPRVELVEEFYTATGRRIHFYSPERFLQHAFERGNFTHIRAESIGEVQQVSEEENPFRELEMLSDQLELLDSRRRRIELEIGRLERVATKGSDSLIEDLDELELQLDRAKEIYEDLTVEQEQLGDLVSEADDDDERSELLRDLSRIRAERVRTRDTIIAITKKTRMPKSIETRHGVPKDRARVRRLRQELGQLQTDMQNTVAAMSELQ